MKKKCNVRTFLYLFAALALCGAAQGQDMRSMTRDFAQLRADMRYLQEAQNMLADRITTMGQELVAKDAQIAELQKMLAAQDARIQAFHPQ